MRRSVIFLSCILATSFLAAPAPLDGEVPLAGGPAAASSAAGDWEARFLAVPSPDVMRANMKRLSARPHHLGSPYGKENAEWILARFQEWGFDAKIEVFHVLFPTPKERVLELLEPTRFRAVLEEPALSVDPTSGQKNEQLPTYNAYSVDGDVTGPLVYVNYGLPEDYDQLERMGVSVKGAIVIARYGNSWRGIKPKVAAEKGAIGCILYSDPRDDGYFLGKVFPEGPMRPPLGAQRGSVLDMPLHSGDPLTPGIGATSDAKRLSVKDAPAITKIPVLPISYADAQPLLAALDGRLAPEAWRGALPIPYHLGPGPARVHLKLAFNWDIKPLYDVIARIPGSVRPDEWIVRGNHHDAWVNGAEDPISGLVVLLEEARALGELMKQGWRPQRTIIYAAWDGEEPMLLGSTEWAETHAEELQRHAVAYINTDGNGRGFLSMAGSHTLEAWMNEVARGIKDPETGLSVWQRRRHSEISKAKTAEDRKLIRERADLRLEALGSGSDYTPFLQHLGIASLNLYFGGEDDGGIYHSIYDDFYWYTHFSDTEFVYGRALAQTAGTAVLRLADAELLPHDFRGLADTVQMYVKELKTLLKDRQEEFAERAKQLDEGVFAAVSDPRRPTAAPKREEIPPHLNFAPLENASDRLTRSAERFHTARAGAQERHGGKLPAALASALNAKLLSAEQRLTHPDGLPRRPWYKHLLYAPGFYTGYGVKTVPGVREAIEQKSYKEAEAEILRVAAVLEGEAEWVDAASLLLEESGPAK